MVRVGVGLGVLMLGLVGCHDAHRDNPFDPELTPAVELISAVVDTTSGTATLEWTPYVGQQPFSAYWVMRKVRGIEGDTLLTAIPDVHRTRFGDPSLEPNRVYVYWIAVVNQGGFVQSSAPDTVVSFSVHGSVWLEAVVDEVKGSVSLRWSPYRGPRFQRYELSRRAGVEPVESPVVFPESSDTTWTDPTVDPETEYVYSLVTFAAGEQRTTEVRVTTFSVQGSALLEARADSLKGTVFLRWERYRGPRFERYEIRRSPVALKSVTQQTDTTWVDTTALPETAHVYSVGTFAAGQERVSNEMSVRYHLPSVELLRAEWSSTTATAELSWSVYSGPWFAGYEVHRQAGEFADQIVAVLTDRDRTTYTDSLLDGNTTYTYWISVRTSWGIHVSGNSRAGSFYALEEVRMMQGVDVNTRSHAVGLAIDEEDGLYVAMTTISTTTARDMRPGIRLALPGQAFVRPYFFVGGWLPHRLSPVRVAAGHGRIYVSVAFNDSTLIGALDTRGSVLWDRRVPTEGAFPVGLYVEENGGVWMVDGRGRQYGFGEDGDLQDQDNRLQAYVETPLQQVVVGPGAGIGGDLFFMLSPEREDYHVLGRTRLPNGMFGGRTAFDEGVGQDKGQTLHPVALSLDRARVRLLVLEDWGRVQVFDAASNVQGRRYITQWGAYGERDGEFLIPLPISAGMEVDSTGRVYVADGSGRIQVFRP